MNSNSEGIDTVLVITDFKKRLNQLSLLWHLCMLCNPALARLAGMDAAKSEEENMAGAKRECNTLFVDFTTERRTTL